MAVADPPLTSSVDAAGRPLVGLGVPLLDEYLEFVAGRCRPNTVLATAFDLKVFFSVVGKAPAEVTAADVLGFITAQRTGGDGHRLRSVDVDTGVSLRTVRRRLSSVSGLFGYLHARGEHRLEPGAAGVADAT